MWKKKTITAIFSVMLAIAFSFSLGELESARLSDTESQKLTEENEKHIQFLEKLFHSATSTLDQVSSSYKNECSKDFITSLRGPIFHINGAIEIGIIDIKENSGLLTCGSWGKSDVKTRKPIPKNGFFLSGPHTSNLLNQKIYVIKKTTDNNEFNILIKHSSIKNLLQDIKISRSDKPEENINNNERKTPSRFINNINYIFQYKIQKEASTLFYFSVFSLSFLIFNFIIIPFITFNIMKNKLRNSMSKGILFNVYQPIVDSKSGDIFSHEVFTRTAQDQNATSLIEKIKKYGLMSDHTIKQINQVEEERHLFPCATFQINLSSTQLSNKNLLLKLKSLNKEFRKEIIIEITEDEDLFLHRDFIKKVMIELKALGYRFALDDFGSGFSNFSYLFEFDFDIVKIDKSIIKSRNHTFLKSFIGIFNSLNIQCIMEGVERKEERDMLNEMDISYHQGWLYGRAEKAPH